MSEACLLAAKSALVGVANGDSLASAICAAMEAAAPVARHLQETTVDLTTLQETVDTIGLNLQGTMDGLNTLLLLYGGALVFLMHGGSAMLEAGAIRSKNAMNILLQTVLDASCSALMWYFVGFAFAFGIGDKPNKFIGNAMFALVDIDTHNTGSGTGKWIDWFFQWAFAATAVTIPAGAVAERFNFNAYLGYSMFIGGWVYPIIAHWVWCIEGWLGYGVIKPFINAGMIDFAGSGVIHMTGGLAGLIGAIMVGPRLGRFDADGKPVDMPGHSAILVVLGTVLLWFGWYGFNPASVLLINSSTYAIVCGRAAVCTTLAGAAGGVSCLIFGFARHRGWDLVGLCNGILCGFVAVTACPHVIYPWAAIICGLVAGLWFEFLCWLLLKLKIDDPLSAGPMHFGCGMWGVFFTGLFARQQYIQEYYVHGPSAAGELSKPYPWGAFYKGYNADGELVMSDGKLLASQIVGILVIIGWVIGMMVPFFGIFQFFGALRIPPEEEEMGLDRSKHGGSAYNGTGANTLGGLSPGNDVMRNNSPLGKVLPVTA
uniref:Ammonium transporter n=1 Tax=Chlamydomonas reinhardtii TaxID=3055 RepID=Q8LJU0_CHLRE|nr:putative ammonium transporter AMT1;2 [Chlamydomonas reinhardtii]